ncbi:gamma-glutamylcyclotransferase family protein [Haloferula sp.]|uniref:gamma-glutamylcyclotransferase family protein n=1 Tax=Haloferula sp. TaxID=2497595 RepID=UPI00329DC725
MNANGELVFVYGTLRRDASNAFRMEGAEFEGVGLVKGRLYVVDWYPAFVRKGGDGWVEGELWRVSDDQMGALDEFEGSEYRRVRVEARTHRSVKNESWDEALQVGDGEKREAWAWEWIGSVEGLKVIKSGDWMDVEKPRPPKVCTCMGCLVLPAIPIGSAIIISWVQQNIWDSHYLNWIGKGLLLMTPVVAFLLAYWGQQRRENGEGLREAVVGVSIIWATLSALTLIISFIAFVLS